MYIMEGGAPPKEVIQPPPTEFRSIKPLDSQQRTKQVEALFSDIKGILDYLNSTRGVWRGTEEETTKLDKLNASAKSLNDPKLEECGVVE
jgi:hypothetical protein